MCMVKYCAAVQSLAWSNVLDLVSCERAGRLLLITNSCLSRLFQLHSLFQGGCFSLLLVLPCQRRPNLEA